MSLSLQKLGVIFTMSACLQMSASALTLIVATVDNQHMLRLQTSSHEFQQLRPDISIKWITLPEGQLRRMVAGDLQTQGRQFDVVTLGMYEVSIWAQRGWLSPIRPSPSYEEADLLESIRSGLSLKGELYAAPIYGESSILYYRKDLLAKAKLKMPPRPTWNEIERIAGQLHDPSRQINGICLRAKPGWGENMTLVTTMVNTYGGQWFDMQWKPVLQSPAWHEAISMYSGLLRKYGPSDAINRGYNENLALFNAGRCAIWVDASVAAGFLTNRKLNPYAGSVGFAQAPTAITAKGANWLWTWALAIPVADDLAHVEAARAFVTWATSREYVRKIANSEGWSLVPSGVRASTYAEAGYIKAAPWAAVELEAIRRANPMDATLNKSPYWGIQFAAIPQFASIGDSVGQLIADVVSGQLSVDTALERSQMVATRYMVSGDLPAPKK